MSRPGPGRTLGLGLLALGLALGPVPAVAFQFYFFFEGPSSDGEGGGRYFTGSPRYKRYDCRICHVGAPRVIRVRLRTEPQDVFAVGYVPGRTYTVRLSLLEETRAPDRKLFSTNNFCVEAMDGAGRSAGIFDLGFPWSPFTQLFDPVVLSPDGRTVLSGFFNQDLVWQWLWTAPPAGTGTVTFYGGLVDGNGDIKAFNDDVAVLRRAAVETGRGRAGEADANEE